MILQSSEGNVTTNRAIQFDDLNNDVLLEVFDTLPFEDLLSLADMNLQIRELITKHHAEHRFRISEKLISIYGTNFLANKSYEKKFKLERNEIGIFDHLSALRFLRNFGATISKIDIRKWHHEVNKYINEISSDSLNELSITTYSSINMTDAWKKSFKKLTDMSVSSNLVNCKHINFSEIFPSLRSLELKYFNQSAINCFDHHFPHLEKVKLNEISENALRFFELNPQIRNLIVVYYISNMKFLRFISEKLQNIEFMTLDISLPEISEKLENDMIHFKNVKKCKSIIVIDRPAETVVVPIVFDQLEEMEIRTWYKTAAWEEFILRHNKLKILTISVTFNGRDLLMIIEKLPSLIKLNIGYLFDVEDEVIASLMEGLMREGINLKKITMTTTRRNCDLLRNSLNSKWRIKGECQVTLIHR